MVLTSGSRLGPYEIIGPLGKGGMGEVYRARDSKLNRDVAIKVLPAIFASDPERLARFTREAQTLAALNHPNIATIYGIEESAPPTGSGPGLRALVMELVEGRDLSDLIGDRGRDVADSIAIARQIADALEAAHDQGIVHRDLKPANVKVRADGAVKVLDFGLAKALSPDGTGTSADAMNSPTMTGRATEMGLILGTAAYMAPEQARGKSIDRRADIWAFGVVLYELLTRERAFKGDDITDILASVLRQEIDWSLLPADTPASVRRLLRRCLEKDPRKRLSAISDARLELDETHDPDAREALAPAKQIVAGSPSWFSRLWPALATAMVGAALAFAVWPAAAPPADGGAIRSTLLAPTDANLYPDSTGVAISPDGQTVAFIVGTATQSDSQLWVRSLDSMVARRLEGGDGAVLPFWSPDSKRIGFFTNSKLKTIAASGGRAETLCDAPGPRGGTWNATNTILFAPDFNGPLYRIPAGGGTPTPVTTLDAARKELGHRFPTFLPDGEHFLYVALPGKNGKFDVFAGALGGGTPTHVGSMESAPVYAAPGWLLHMRQGVLAAQAFDVRTRTLTGEPVPLGDEPSSILDPTLSFTAGWVTSVSRTGSLAYFSSPSAKSAAIWIDAGGRTLGTLDVPPGHYEKVAISPDGAQAVFVKSISPSESTLWLIDLARGGAAPISSGHGRNDNPVWSPDGTRVVFAADRDGPQDFFVKTVADATLEQMLFRSGEPFKSPDAWSPDGRWIVMTQLDPQTAQNIWLVPAKGGGSATVYVRGPGRDNGGPVSPDGRSMAYAAEDTGRLELYVQSFPEPAGRVQVSREGVAVAWWTRDGRQLVYASGDLRTLWRVDVESGPTRRVGAPIKLATLPSNVMAIDAMPDRQKFLAIVPERAGVGSMTIVQNWTATLRK